ncbi:MAG TPA: carboxypeptidase regulatory-like domain-containing protein [Bryobacteraceae bacterium]|nr:carboxypeptidase regulatory-like domain-containing protein [Bryobacteraceae bacterium]
MPAGRLLALFVCFGAIAAAQRLADLHGWVLDTSGGGIADAAITVVNEDTGFRRVTQSETGGGYTVASLRPGNYKIFVLKEGFKSAVRFDVQVSGSGASRADFVLPVGTRSESITVTGVPPLIDRQDASTGASVDRDQIERLPLDGRGILTLLELAPGTNVTPATRGEAGQFSATGQRANTNYFTVDGISANTGVAAGGVPAQSPGGALPALSAFGSMDSMISLDSVQDLRVTTSSSGAEMGRLPGANVALNSRSGTNELHGTTQFRIRNELLSANNWFANQAGYGSLPLRLLGISQTFGGPLKHNHTFFLLSYEGVQLRQPYSWNQPVPSLDSRDAAADWAQPLLNLYPAPSAPGVLANGIGEWFGRSVRPASVNVGGARLDQALGSRVSLFARYNDSPSSNDFGALTVNHLDLRSQSLTLGMSARPTTNSTVDVRANESQSTADSKWVEPGLDGCALQSLTFHFFRDTVPCDYLVRFSIGGIGQLVSGSEGERRQRQFQLVQNASWHRRSHNLNLGLDYRRITGIRRDPVGTFGVFADDLTSLEFGQNIWRSVESAPVNYSVEIHELSLWVQDTWQVTSRFTLSAGLRWEYSPPPPATGQNFFDPATNSLSTNQSALWPVSDHDFAPRLGVALRLTQDGKTMLRAGGGLYYDSSMSIATDVLNGGPLSIGDYQGLRGGLSLYDLNYGFVKGLHLPTVRQWNVSLERSFGEHDVASIGYLGAYGRNLVLREVGTFANIARSYLALTSNNGQSNYQALQLQYRRQLSRGLQTQVSYAWSHSIDNDSSDAYLLWYVPGFSDRGSSDFDQRQSFTAAASYEFPLAGRSTPVGRFLRGWGMDGILHARSGFPISVLDAEQYLGLTLVNAFRPNLVYGQPLWLADSSVGGGRRLNPAAFQALPGALQGTLGRNALTGFGMAQLDFALRREFRFSERRRLQLRLEAYNLLNHANFADPVSYLNSPVFGQSTSLLNLMLGSGSPGSGLSPVLQTGGARSLQASLRFQF